MAESRQLKLYNSLTRSIEPLTALPAHDVFGFYCCGPTVYGRAHIGNFRAFVCADLLVRTLRAFGYPLKFVMNLTDVDDKTIRGACQEKVSLAEFTKKHEESYWKDREALSISKPDIEPRATGHIAEMIRLVERLVAAKHAYIADDGSVYYRIDSFKNYGCLCHLDRGGLRAGARVAQDEYEKESIADFVLWKKHRPEDGDVKWNSPWGPGRPGWHLECSAMSMKHLGESYELHGGGVDLLFPHHENEIAQSEGATGKPFVKHWWHVAHLLVDGRKMSKSLGNLYTLEDIRGMGFDEGPHGKLSALRYALISVHYREPLNFTKSSLVAAREAIERLRGFGDRLHEAIKFPNLCDPLPTEQTAKALEAKFFNCLAEDLNISAALGELFASVRQINTLIDKERLSANDAKEWLSTLEKIDSILGIKAHEARLKKPSDEGVEVLNLINQRDEARVRKDWATSDRIRDELAKRGLDVEDTPKGTQVKRRR